MASLESSASKLGYRKAKHLLRRTSFNYSKAQIDLFAEMTPSQALLALTTDPPDYVVPKPYDYRTDQAGYSGYWTDEADQTNNAFKLGRLSMAVSGWWWYNAMQGVPSLKYKLSFFLHTCFTVGKQTGAGNAAYFFDHLRLLDFYALGNIKTLAKKINLDDSMLNYLDNTTNKDSAPNENYAREYFELFTILKGEQIGPTDYTNYTENDIVEAARVLTGFRRNEARDNIDPDTGLPKGITHTRFHDYGTKTFSAAFGNKVITGGTPSTDDDDKENEAMFTELHDFVDMVFNERETAKSYCRKIYRYFVKPLWGDDVETDIITPLAGMLYDNDYEILPVITKLLTSKHFYDEDNDDTTDEIVGGIIKSPLQLLSEICSVFNVEIPNPDATPVADRENFYLDFFRRFVHDGFFELSGFGFFDPETVAGYPAYFQSPSFDENWFSSNAIIARYKVISILINGKNNFNNRSGDIHAQIDTLVFAENNISNPEDPNILVTEIANLLYCESITERRRNQFKGFLLDGGLEGDFYWENAWSDYTSTKDNGTMEEEENKAVVKNRLDALITAMVNAAEFQVM